MSEAHRLAAALVSLGRAVRAHQGELLQPHGLHPGQDALLLEVWDEPGLNQAALAARLGVESPTVTRMVSRLERVGLVERRSDADDGRCTRVHPTPRSRLLEGSIRRVWATLGDELVRDMGTSDANTLTALANRAVQAMRSAASDS